MKDENDFVMVSK